MRRALKAFSREIFARRAFKTNDSERREKGVFFPVAKGNKGFAFTLPRPPPATGKSTVIARLHFNVLGTRPKMYLKDSYYAPRYSLMDNLSTFTIFNIFESFEIGFFRDKKRRDILLGANIREGRIEGKNSSFPKPDLQLGTDTVVYCNLYLGKFLNVYQG